MNFVENVRSSSAFLYINIGANGRAGEAGVFNQSSLFTALEQNKLDIPADHVILSDDAFPLKTCLLKPYSYSIKTTKEKIFNYQLSRARNRVENTFGILSTRFRIFLKPMEVKPCTVDKIVWAACSLHNWLRKTSPKSYIPPGSVDTEDLNTGEVIPALWRNITDGLLSASNRGGRYKDDANNIRSMYATYFMGKGAVPWQWQRIGLSEELDEVDDVLTARLEEEMFDDVDECVE